MEFPRVDKRPEELLSRDEKKIGIARRISLNLMLIGSMLLRPAAPEPQAAPTPEPQVGGEPKHIEAKQRLIRVGKRLQQLVSILDPARFFQHRSHASHYSHYSHVSHASHYSHYSGSPPPPVVVPPVQSTVSITAAVRGMTVTFDIIEGTYTPRHDVHRW